MTRSSLILLAAVFLSGAPGFAANNHKAINFYTIPQEIAMGRQMAAEVEKQSHIVDDPIVAEYINRLGQNIALRANAEFPITVKMIQSDSVDAFTLPGGFVYISSGMARLADNEAELISVIAHEVGHAAARHATRQATRGQMGKLVMIPLSVLSGWGGLAARQAANVAGPVAAFHFSRAFETEADLLSVGYLSNSGYDPNASIDMFERIQSMERKTPGVVARLFLTHPPTGDRIARTQKEIAKLTLERDAYILNTSEFEAVRKLIISGQ